MAIWPLERWVGNRLEATSVEREWPEELFYDIVEALHDVVARPRKRTWHDYAREWDYFDFARTPGQAI
jgi:hypothetical protein